MTNMRTTLRLSWSTIFVFLMMFVLITTAFAAAIWAGNKMGPSFYVWAPLPSNASKPWENGNPKGYREGDTAAIAAPVTANVSDGQLQFQLCLDQNASQTGAYAFTKIEPWDTTISNLTELPDGTPINYADGNWDVATDPNIWGYNVTIVSITDGDPGGLCGTGYIGWRVVFEMKSDGLGYIVTGAHIATPGDPLPYGGSVTVVPPGMGALAVNGVFQVRFVINPSQSGADKTVNFQSKDLLPPTAITLMDFRGSATGFEWPVYALIAGALALLGMGSKILFQKSHMAN
ncbi:MAG TPA: hypothetical protein VE136_08335 [Anaerolineales bacterium]|nr:hypothetical protein [Anaerolineales bacterium]